MVLQRHVLRESRQQSGAVLRSAAGVSVGVVVPWRSGGCEHRQRAWGHLKPRYPWPVIEAPGREPWCKAAAVTPAVEATDADIVVVADADVWCDGLPDAVRAVQAGAPWAVPHYLVHRLTEDATENWLSGRPDETCEQAPYAGICGGGIVVAAREVLEAIPLDTRFVGWGQEDESWAIALTCLLGEPWRGIADLWHLWHPPQQRITRTRGTMDGWLLRRRYVRASHDPVVMRALIEEGRHAAERTPESALHDHQAHPVGYS